MALLVVLASEFKLFLAAPAHFSVESLLLSPNWNTFVSHHMGVFWWDEQALKIMHRECWLDMDDMLPN